MNVKINTITDLQYEGTIYTVDYITNTIVFYLIIYKVLQINKEKEKLQFSIIKIDAIKDIVALDKLDESGQSLPVDHILLGSGPNVRYVDLDMIKNKGCKYAQKIDHKKGYIPTGASKLAIDIFNSLSKTY